MGTKIVQHNIFGEMEEILTKKTRKEVLRITTALSTSSSRSLPPMTATRRNTCTM